MKDRQTTEHLQEIGKRFLTGYHLALKHSRISGLIENLEHQPHEYRGFCYEGAAMCHTILDRLGIFTKKRFSQLLSPAEGQKHVYMLHVGAGWAYARLPFNIEKNLHRYHEVLRWLVIDGYGFHQAYFKTKKYVHEHQEPRALKTEFSKHVFYQGVGRCLWFVEGAHPVRIHETIQRFPAKYHSDLWAGAGLACTYAGGADEQSIEAMKELSAGLLPHFAQGAVFAAAARHRAGLATPHTEMACSIICGISVTAAAALADDCLSRIPDHLSSPEKYEAWRKLIREHFIKLHRYESVY